jgi:carbon monoxide dehydrogenase subunit G
VSDAPDLVVSTTVARSPQEVWSVVADPSRLVAHSPEAHHVRADASGPLPVGALFTGSNRRSVFRWSTRCRVVESTPGEAFAFEVAYLGMAVALWRYVLQPDGAGTRVEEQWTDRRGVLMKAIGAVGTGVADRRAHNERTMRATLESLTRALEAS